MIDDMKSGRELDAELAQLLGHKTLSVGGYWWMDEPFFPLPQYSTTWEGMRLVVEEMQRRGYAFGVLWSDKTKIARFHSGSTRIVAESTGSEIPHAAVLAAIKAIQGEDTK